MIEKFDTQDLSEKIIESIFAQASSIILITDILVAIPDFAFKTDLIAFMNIEGQDEYTQLIKGLPKFCSNLDYWAHYKNIAQKTYDYRRVNDFERNDVYKSWFTAYKKVCDDNKWFKIVIREFGLFLFFCENH